MKAAIVYATKTGTTEKAARRLAEALKARGVECEPIDLAKGQPAPNADAYLVGGSLRMGHWHKAALQFVKQNEALLLAHPLALFVARCGKDDTRALLLPQAGDAILSHAVFADSIGGELDINKQKGLDKFVVRMIAKSDNAADMQPTGVLEARIDACADAIVAAMNA